MEYDDALMLFEKTKKIVEATPEYAIYLAHHQKFGFTLRVQDIARELFSLQPEWAAFEDAQLALNKAREKLIQNGFS